MYWEHLVDILSFSFLFMKKKQNKNIIFSMSSYNQKKMFDAFLVGHYLINQIKYMVKLQFPMLRPQTIWSFALSPKL